jgi:DNA polymerase elongation subunit (family B)
MSLSRVEIEKLSDAELKELLHQKEFERAKYKTMQLAYKVTLNSAYGAVGNQYFRFYDVDMAEAITISGQLSIQWIQRKVNDFLNSYLKTENHDYIIAGDTDSVVGDSVIYIDGKQITIEDFYNSLPDEYAKFESGNEVKYVSDNKSLSLNDSGNLEYKNVIYAMKHEVEKEMFEVEIDGKKVTITGDHSLIVFRNNEYISCTVYDIKDGDEIIFL